MINIEISLLSNSAVRTDINQYKMASPESAASYADLSQYEKLEARIREKEEAEQKEKLAKEAGADESVKGKKKGKKSDDTSDEKGKEDDDEEVPDFDADFGDDDDDKSDDDDSGDDDEDE